MKSKKRSTPWHQGISAQVSGWRGMIRAQRRQLHVSVLVHRTVHRLTWINKTNLIPTRLYLCHKRRTEFADGEDIEGDSVSAHLVMR